MLVLDGNVIWQAVRLQAKLVWHGWSWSMLHVRSLCLNRESVLLGKVVLQEFSAYSTRMFHGESDHAFPLSKNIAAGWARVRLRAFRKLSYLKAAYRRASSRQERQRTVRSASIFDGQIFHLYHCTRNKFLSKFSHADRNVQIWGKNTRAIMFTTKPHTVLFLIHCLSCSNESPKLHTSIIPHTPMERKAPMFH